MSPSARAPSRKHPPLPWLVPGVVLGGLLPLALMLWDATQGLLGANPVQRATQQTGLLALVLLLASLACTPLRRLTGQTWPARVRKALGLLAFGYAALHLLIYVVVDHALELGVIVEDVLERPFITVGFGAVLLLLPLALTSTRGAVRRLGFVRWQRLHRLVYLSAGLAALHFVWQTKQDPLEPLLYAGALALLLGARAVWALRKRGDRG